MEDENTGLTGGSGNADDAGNNNDDGGGGGGGNEAPTYSSPFNLYNEDGAIADNVALIKNEATRNFISKYNSEEALNNGIKEVGFLSRSKGFEPLPGDANDADRAKHQERLTHLLGLPENVDGYGITKPEGMEEAAWEAMNVNEYLDVALKHNVTPEAMKALMELDGVRGEAAAEAAKTAVETAQAEQHDLLTQKYGGKIQAMYKKADQVADLLGLPRSQINSVEVVEALNKASEYISESKLTNSNQGEANNKEGTYKDQADAIMNDPTNRFYNDIKSGDMHRNKIAMAEHTRLMKLHSEQQKGNL